MDAQELRNLQEAYNQVHQVDEAEKWIQKAIKKPGALSKQLGVPEDEKIPSGKLAAAAKKGGKLGKRARLAMTLKGLRREEIDIYDIILTHLLDEGYAETSEAAEVIMVNMSEEWRQDIMEISQKTAIKAYAQRATGEYEYDTNPSDQTKSGKYKSDVARERIKKKFGKKAAKHADRAAHAQIFGRKGAGGMPSAD